jgi:hypothetical protein
MVLELDLEMPTLTVLIETETNVFGKGYMAYNSHVETVVIMKPDQLPLLGRKSHTRKDLYL